MPIKFRCGYCRQFLGIARNRAGQVVDCPSCGRSIRVPGLDGASLPIPTPELDLKDSQLAKALDVLASLELGIAGDHTTDPTDSGTSTVMEDDSVDLDDEIPQPLVEPIPIEVAIAPQPITIQPKVATTVEGQSLATGEPLSEAAVQLELTRLLAQAAESKPATFAVSPLFPTQSPTVPPSKSGGKVLVGLVAGVIVGAAGMYGYEESRRTKIAASTATTAQPEPVATVKGRISYTAAAGDRKPDAGARIFILPQDRRGTIKLGMAGLKRGDDEVDQQAVAAVFHACGGGFAVANDKGEFSLSLPQTGAYRILVLSRFQERPESTPLDADALQLLGCYLEDPAGLCGRVQLHSSPLQLKSTGESTWDHVFE